MFGRVVAATSRRRFRGRLNRSVRSSLVLAAVVLFVGCRGPQSALSPAGRGAEQLFELFIIMALGAAVIWAIVVGLGVHALLWPGAANPRKAALYVIGGGAFFPTLVLTALLAYGLAILPGQVEPAPEGSLQIKVTGHQWWWRVEYASVERPFATANEIHLPVGEPVQFLLESGDVIHAFWIPSLGGKVDMIPGRQTRLTLHPTRTGVFRGTCAEYCGGSHAWMSFDVVVQEKDEFERWLAQQAAPAQQPESAAAARGAELFLANGCGACHAVRGTPADGRVGPDLTHVGGRLTLGAGLLSADEENFHTWIANPNSVKPEAKMPHFSMLAPDDLRALSTYLDGLR